MNVQIVDALRFGDEGKASCLLWNSDCKQLSAEDLLPILGYCSTAPKPLFAMEVWKFMDEKNIKVNQNCSTLMLLSLIKSGYLDQALNWLKLLGKSHQTKPHLSIFNAFLRSCNQNSDLANECLQLMDEQFIGRSEETYGELLKLAVQQHNLVAVNEIWEEYRKYYTPRLVCIHKFICAFSKLGDSRSAYDTLQYMIKATCPAAAVKVPWKQRRYASRLDIPIPSINQHSISLGSGVAGDDSVESVPRSSVSDAELKADTILSNCDGKFGENDCVFPTMPQEVSLQENQFCRENVVLNSSSEVQYGSMNPVICGSTNVSPVQWGLSERLKKLLVLSFNNVIQACGQSEDCEMAESLLQQMTDLGLKPSKNTYRGLLRAVVSVKGITWGMQVVEAMKMKKLALDNALLSIVAVGYSKCLELDLAEGMLNQLDDNSPKYIYPFNYLLAACEIQDEPERAIRVFEKIKHLNIKPNIRTYELLFSLLGKVNAPYTKGNMLSQIHVSKRIQAVEMDMAKNEIQHSAKSLENLMRVLGAEGLIREMIHYLDVAEHYVTGNDASAFTAMYNTVLHELVETKESYKAAEIFRKMKLFKIPCTTMTYNIMIHCCSMTRCYRSACSLLAMMLRDGLQPVIQTFTSLIETVAGQNFLEALYFLDQASSAGIKSDVVLYNAILEKAYFKRRLDILELIIERMHLEKVQPDPTTCRYALCAYIYHGFHSTAVEALQVLSIWMISQDEDKQQEFRSKYEDLVQSEDPEVEHQIVEIFKDSKEYLAVALLNLRWCALMGVSLSWLPAESPWARRLAGSCGKTEY
ncbi:pentatricopeptide repeat-containing protein At1g76280 isoform X2 [Nymphaea colorata]|nr:pentatricopeptide repeat-containing protein At1g76280 isoform X2 [Nymphaea colorata]